MDDRTRYLTLLKQVLTDILYDTEHEADRREGRDWPARGYTMIGLTRLDNLHHCVEHVLRARVPGDLVETGVWRGGATVFMRALLEVHGVRDRLVWACDSFAGLPPPDPERYPADAGDRHHTDPRLAVSLEDVRATFRRFGLLDAQVRFLAGWFRDTLPAAPIERIAVLRLDGDMYESTMEALVHLYPKVSPGGYVIVDDYGAVPSCKRAVDDYREAQGVQEPLLWMDWAGTYWRRQPPPRRSRRRLALRRAYASLPGPLRRAASAAYHRWPALHAGVDRATGATGA